MTQLQTAVSAASARPAASGGEVETRPLSPAIGVEIVGADLSQPLDQDVFDRIHRAWEENCVALFRGQRLEEDQQVAFASRFGTLAKLVNATTHTGRNPAVMIISNIRKDGKPIGELPDGEMFFHSDQCYVERPAMATMLFSIEIPSYGGNTCYANAFRAYDALPEELKKKLDGKLALHAFDYDGSLGGNPTKRAEDLPPEVKHYAHPIFRTHPPTGRKALYVNRLMTQSIVGMSPEESREILYFLFDHQEKKEFVYEHVWKTGDLLVWDNRSCLHARTDFPGTERRLMRRVTVLGEKPY